MNNQEMHQEIYSYAGMSLEIAVLKLQDYNKRGEKVFIEFNGKKLYSDKVTLDSAYLEVTGKTKADFDKARREELERYRKEKEAHKAKIPELTKEWITKGHTILNDKYWEAWDKCVPIRLGDLYKGMELGMCLDIVKSLNDGCTMDEAKTIIDNQGHSYMSFHLVRGMVKAFCDRGEEFAAFVND